MQRTAMWN